MASSSSLPPGAEIKERLPLKRENEIPGGLKHPDLSLFRNASISRRVNITLTGGDVYIAAPNTSDMAVLWGESFGSKERKFLRELLASETVSFSLKDTYQIHVRTLWHAGVGNSALSLATGGRRQGKFAMLLHDFVGELTTSWTWAKFIRPLHRQGFSVIAVDLPGFGKSAVAQVCACGRTKWEAQGAHVVSKIMEELSVARCQVLAVGQTSGLLFKVLQGSPHRMAGQHVLVNPVFDRNALFAHVGCEPPPGAKAGWQEVIKEKQQSALIDLLRTTGVKIWCLFDRNRNYRGNEQLKKAKGAPSAPSKELQKEWNMALETSEMLFNAAKHEIVANNLNVTEITENDLCEAQIGKKVPIRMFIPSRHLKASISRFLGKHNNQPWDTMYTPTHIAFHKGLSRSAKSGKANLGRLEEFDRFEDSEHSSSDDEKKNPRGKDYGKLALADMSAKGVDRMMDRGRMDETDQDREARLAIRDNAEAAEIDAYNKQTKEDERRRAALDRMAGDRRTMKGSASAPQLKRSHTLYAAADVATQRLNQSGANRVGAAVMTAETQREMKGMNWAKVPYEPDLSYGVRKMYLDSFEASVESYKEEQELEYEKQKAFKNRAAFRAGTPPGAHGFFGGFRIPSKQSHASGGSGRR